MTFPQKSAGEITAQNRRQIPIPSRWNPDFFLITVLLTVYSRGAKAGLQALVADFQIPAYHS
jgi:hypothetical protein